jgi:hypothetical protein
MREKSVLIEVRKTGQHWSVFAEDQLIAHTVYEKGAQTLEATLRGLLRYNSRKFFRLAVSDAMNGPKPVAAAKAPQAPQSSQGRRNESRTGQESDSQKGARHRHRPKPHPRTNPFGADNPRAAIGIYGTGGPAAAVIEALHLAIHVRTEQPPGD